MKKTYIIAAISLAAAIGSSSPSHGGSGSKPDENRVYCERQAAGDWRRLKICLSYVNSPPQPVPEVKKPPEPKVSRAPTVKGRSAKGYPFMSESCYQIYRWRWQAARLHKAFAVATQKAWEVCDGSYGWPSIGKAESEALQHCRELAKRDHVDTKVCKLIEVE